MALFPLHEVDNDFAQNIKLNRSRTQKLKNSLLQSYYIHRKL